MEKRIGIYIHIPFCTSKCAYCDFYSLAGKDKLMPDYQRALLQHIKEYSRQLSGYYVDTVYFGGGTPSHFGADRLIAVFNALKKYGKVLLDAEVTAEVNPDSISTRDMISLRKAGFNRLSIGVQSANDAMLKDIGRTHTFSKAEEAVKNAREAGFTNVSIDLMYGLPSQTKDDWAETLARAVALKPDHISCYGLKLEEGTPLYIFRDSPFVPDDDMQADMYLYAVETLARFGLRQYEISNFARRGFESRHNMKYWNIEEYIGFGAAAHSFIGSQRYGCISDVQEYCDRMMSGDSVMSEVEQITDFDRAGEYLMLRLRTTRGIRESEYREIYSCSLNNVLKLLELYEERGMASHVDDRWFFTPRGFLVSNVLISAVLDAHSRQRTEDTKPWLRDEQESQREREDQMSMFGPSPKKGADNSKFVEV